MRRNLDATETRLVTAGRGQLLQERDLRLERVELTLG